RRSSYVSAPQEIPSAPQADAEDSAFGSHERRASTSAPTLADGVEQRRGSNSSAKRAEQHPASNQYDSEPPRASDGSDSVVMEHRRPSNASVTRVEQSATDQRRPSNGSVTRTEQSATDQRRPSNGSVTRVEQSATDQRRPSNGS